MVKDEQGVDGGKVRRLVPREEAAPPPPVEAPPADPVAETAAAVAEAEAKFPKRGHIAESAPQPPPRRFPELHALYVLQTPGGDQLFRVMKSGPRTEFALCSGADVAMHNERVRAYHARLEAHRQAQEQAAAEARVAAEARAVADAAADALPLDTLSSPPRRRWFSWLYSREGGQ